MSELLKRRVKIEVGKLEDVKQLLIKWRTGEINIDDKELNSVLNQFAGFRQGNTDVTVDFASLCYQYVNNGFLAISESNAVAIFPNKRSGVIVIDFIDIVDGKLRLTDMRSLSLDEESLDEELVVGLKSVINTIIQVRAKYA